MPRQFDSRHYRALAYIAVLWGSLLNPQREHLLAQTSTIQPPADWQFEYDLFQMSLEQAGLAIVADDQELLANPRESVIVALGATSISMVDHQLRQFVLRGGRVLLASDVSYSSTLGRFMGIQVTTNVRDYQYEGYLDCVRVDITSQDTQLLRGVGSVVFNGAGFVASVDASIGQPSPIVRWPRYVTPRSAQNAPVLLVSSNTDDSSLRVILCSDSSLFSNGMLWHGDNALLAINVSQQLSKGRSKLMFIAGGMQRPSYQRRLLEIGADALPPPPVPEQLPELKIEQMLRLANTVIANSQDSDLLNAIVANRPRRIPTVYYRRGLLFALALAILGLVAYRVSKRAVTPARNFGVPLHQTDRIDGRELQEFSEEADLRRGQAAQLLAVETLQKLSKSDAPEKWLLIGSASDSRSWTVDQLGSIQKLVDLATSPAEVSMTLAELVEVDRLAQSIGQE